ncbi:MAG TPA: PIG-L family deacetylase [Bryobacteraceae bacterium]|nr:PIG-L family deacetylase [Bryobacteraceae bacterium]
MDRREFLGSAALVAGLPTPEVFLERPARGKPHRGKVLAAIQPHADDIPLFAAGTVAKLLDEGYTGYLINVTNDDMAGSGTIAETALKNERDVDELARAMGFKQVFRLNYGNHQMDGISRPELRSRFILLFRLLQVDTIVGYDPWGPYEENPDHYVTAACAEAACWMAGMDKDYPEHLAAGLKPKSVREKYYFARGPQLVNRVVDISEYVDRKIDANLVNKAQGPAGETGARLRRELAQGGRRLPLLGTDDRTANRNYVREFVLARDRETGRKHGMSYAEAFHYIGPEASPVEEYIRKNAVPL